MAFTFSLKWEIMRCDDCGSSGIHMKCGRLKTFLDDFVCAECVSIIGAPGKTILITFKPLPPHEVTLFRSGLPGLPCTCV